MKGILKYLVLVVSVKVLHVSAGTEEVKVRYYRPGLVQEVSPSNHLSRISITTGTLTSNVIEPFDGCRPQPFDRMVPR